MPHRKGKSSNHTVALLYVIDFASAVVLSQSAVSVDGGFYSPDVTGYSKMIASWTALQYQDAATAVYLGT